MPTNFNNQLPTVQVGPGSFREQAYVDSTGDLDGLPKAFEEAAEASSDVVLSFYKLDETKAAAKQEEMYSKARKLKRNIYEAALAKDQKAELEFTAQLEDLKIAERQGAISGTNSSVRQETVLKTYINRFPHLEDKFRTLYSSTRSSAQASKEQFEDPIEAGVDAAIKEATAAGMTVGAYLNMKRAQTQLEFDMKNLEFKAKLGQFLEVDIDQTFQTSLVPLAVSSAQQFLKAGVQEFTNNGLDYDGNKAKADFIARGKLEAATAVGALYQLAKKSNNPNAQISRQFLEERRAQIEKVFTDIAASGVFDSFDSLKSMQRSMEIGSIRSLQELGKFSPVLAEIAKRNPEQAGEIIFKDFSRSLELYKKGRRDLLSALGDSATNAIDAARLKYQLAIIDQWQGNELAMDWKNFVDAGTFQSTGDPGVDAAKLSVMVQTVLGSDKTTPEDKANGVKAAIEAEKTHSDKEFAPSPVWYKDPVRRKVLQTNEKAKADFTKTLDNAAADMVTSSLQELGDSLVFAPQPEFEDPRQPWKFYSNGGPFGAPKATGVDKSVATGFSAKEAASRNTTKKLNQMYWSYRMMYGRAAAERWAFQIVDETKAVKEEREAAAEKEGKKSKSSSSGETFDPK